MKHFTAAALLGACALVLSGCMATNPDTQMRKQVVWLHADGDMTTACPHHRWMGMDGEKSWKGKHHRRHHRKAAAKKESAPVKAEKKAEPKKEPVKPAKSPAKKSAE